MTIFEAIILGVIQGLTEFLPISSTAHLTLAGRFMHLINAVHPELWTEFIAVIQLGTLAAVCVYFARDILGMMSAAGSDLVHGKILQGTSAWKKETRLAFLIVIGTLPVALIGLGFRHVIEGSLTKSIPIIASSLIGLALLLWLAERIAQHRREIGSMTWRDGLLIGFAQSLALIPGSSRSGTTITAGLFLGMTREAAARFSFLLSIPAVLASGLLELRAVEGGVFALGMGNLITATVVAGITGYLAIAWLLKYLTHNSTMIFVWYRILLGLFLFALLIAKEIL